MAQGQGPVALITGITGQDGGRMAALLHDKGYRVFGLVRGQNNPRRAEVERALPFVQVVLGDLTDLPSLARAITACVPDEVYNFGAVSHVAYSFDHPVLTMNVTAGGLTNLLEALRVTGHSTHTKVYQASTSEMFGHGEHMPADGFNESSPLRPCSPYGVAKAHAHWLARTYREAYGMFVVCGILFNHEGEHRGTEFVTRKITRAAARIRLGLQDRLELGALWPHRDWGYADDYVRGVWQMMQHDEPDDFVLATGQAHSVEEFLARAFDVAGLGDWHPYVRHDARLERPTEVDALRGDASKAREVLGWRPTVGFDDLVGLMVAHDLREQAEAAALTAPATAAGGR